MATTFELLLAAAGAFFLFQLYSFYRVRNKISSIPTVGSDHFLLSYYCAWKFFFIGDGPIRDGYLKYPHSAFKIPTTSTPTGWMIVVNDEQMVEELRRTPPDILSFPETTADILQTDYLFGRHNQVLQRLVGVVRSPLTRGFPSRFGDIQDEIVDACNVYLPSSRDWEGLVVYDALVHLVCRTSNRLFVGLPLCREPEYQKIQEDWSIQVMFSAHMLHLVPASLKTLAGSYFLSKMNTSLRRVETYLGPTILDRLEKRAQYGTNWEGKPQDLISWLIDEVPEEYLNVEDLTIRVMFINFAAVHTTSLTLTNALLDLAARPEYIEPLRKEIEEVTRTYGWTKDAMGRMRKLDSFIKESGRLAGVSSLSSGRKAMKDFTFSNGVTIPAGYTVSAASAGIHHDPAFYENPEDFDGFRFSEMREKGTNEYDPLRHQMVSLTTTYLLFGQGRSACPGRFFAVNEVKAMMGNILINYDIKLPGDSKVVPPGIWFGDSRGPNTSAQVLFKKRAD